MSAGSTFHNIFDFTDGSDKIQLVSGIISTATIVPTFGYSDTMGADGSINFVSFGSTLVVKINGSAANDYIAIRVTGVSTLDLNDFEFL